MYTEIIRSCHEEGGTEGASAAVLGEVLLEVADPLRQHLDRDVLVECDLVRLCILPCLVDEDPRIRHETGCRTSDVLVDVVDLLDGVRLDESAGNTFVHDQDDTIFELQSDGCRTFLDGLTRVLHLEEPSVGGENGDTSVIGHLSWLHFPFSLLRMGYHNRVYNVYMRVTCARE